MRPLCRTGAGARGLLGAHLPTLSTTQAGRWQERVWEGVCVWALRGSGLFLKRGVLGWVGLDGVRRVMYVHTPKGGV